MVFVVFCFSKMGYYCASKSTAKVNSMQNTKITSVSEVIYFSIINLFFVVFKMSLCVVGCCIVLLCQMPFGPVPDQDRTGHLDLVPGRRIAGSPTAPGCPWGRMMPGWDKRREDQFRRLLTACVCVCVCVCHHSPCV